MYYADKSMTVHLRKNVPNIIYVRGDVLQKKLENKFNNISFFFLSSIMYAHAYESIYI